MKYLAKREFFHHELCSEDGGDLLSIHHHGNHYTISEKGKEPMAVITKKTDTSIILSGPHVEGSETVTLIDSDAWDHPNFAKSLTMTINGDTYTIEQTTHREFNVWNGNTQIGTITRMFHPTVQMNFDHNFAPTLVSIFFVSSLIMLHEDDLVIV